MIKEIQQNLNFWQVESKINSSKYKISIILAENEIDAISDMIEYMKEEGYTFEDLWQSSYKVSQL